MPNAYPMTKKIRGQCLIIDNEKFVNDVLPYREGSMIDSNNLDILYEQLGFKVRIFKRFLKTFFQVRILKKKRWCQRNANIEYNHSINCKSYLVTYDYPRTSLEMD